MLRKNLNLKNNIFLINTKYFNLSFHEKKAIILKKKYIFLKKVNRKILKRGLKNNKFTFYKNTVNLLFYKKLKIFRNTRRSSFIGKFTYPSKLINLKKNIKCILTGSSAIQTKSIKFKKNNERLCSLDVLKKKNYLNRNLYEKLPIYTKTGKVFSGIVSSSNLVPRQYFEFTDFKTINFNPKKTNKSLVSIGTEILSGFFCYNYYNKTDSNVYRISKLKSMPNISNSIRGLDIKKNKKYKNINKLVRLKSRRREVLDEKKFNSIFSCNMLLKFNDLVRFRTSSLIVKKQLFLLGKSHVFAKKQALKRMVSANYVRSLSISTNSTKIFKISKINKYNFLNKKNKKNLIKKNKIIKKLKWLLAIRYRVAKKRKLTKFWKWRLSRLIKKKKLLNFKLFGNLCKIKMSREKIIKVSPPL